MNRAIRPSARTIGTAVLAAAAAAVVTGCAPSGDAADSADLEQISFQTSWIPMVQFGGSYLAAANGYYEDEGLTVDIRPGGPEVDTAAQLAAGQVDIAVTNADNVARANAEGADLVIVAAGFQRNPLALLSMADDPIETPHDMEGRVIGIPAGDNAAHDATVEFNGVDADAVTTVPVSFDVAPLVSGEVDGLYVFYSEQPISLEEQGYEGYTYLLGDYGLDVYAQAYAVTRETLEERRDMVVSFLRAEILGWQDYVEDPAPAVDLAVNEYGSGGGLSESQQTAQAERQMDLLITPETEANGLLWISEDGVAANIATMRALDIEGVDETLFDRSLLEEIYDGSSSL